MKRFALLALLLTLTALPVHGQSSYQEKIISFDSQITITRENVAQITETIVYDFGLNQKRGIFRYVPVTTQVNETDQYYYYDLNWKDITQDGQPAIVEDQGSGDREVVRIGNPDVTISGVHTYKISYELSPVVEQNAIGDFLNLNTVGVNWPVPIDVVNSSVTFPTSAKITEAKCFTGSYGSSEQNCDSVAKSNSATFTAYNLLPTQDMTINITSEGSQFVLYQAPQDPPPPNLVALAPLLIGAAALILGLILRIIFITDHRRRKKDKTIVPQYEPPKDISVGELGTLHDNKSDMKEITATLIDLAVRGYIKITQVAKKSLFKKAEYQFDLLKDKTGLASHEQTLMDLLFVGENKSINLKDVSKTDAGTKIAAIKTAFVTHLESKGFRAQNRTLASQKGINKVYGAMAVAVSVWGAGYLIATTSRGDSSGALIPSAIFALVAIIFGLLVSTTIHITDTGYEKWAEIEGLLLYLTVAEKDRLAFHDAPEKTPELFSSLLPSAIALGVDKEWAKQFKDLDVSKNVNWYDGQNTGFNSVMLASALSHDLNSVVSSSFTPPSQSSSGGFSGGGGGGGGGGSW